jgi:hypothetical protein
MIHGSTKTKFSALGVKAPRVAGGAVANVQDDVDLFVQIQADQVLGVKDLGLK